MAQRIKLHSNFSRKNYSSIRAGFSIIIAGSIIIQMIFSIFILGFPLFSNQTSATNNQSLKQNTSYFDPPPEITSYSITPTTGFTNEHIVFITTYKDIEDMAPAIVQVIIDGIEYNLDPVDKNDDNYTNGKDYFVKMKLSKGTHLVYFKVSDGNSNVSTTATTIRIIEKDTENLFSHLDVAYSIFIATAVFLIPLAYGIYQIRKVERSISKLTEQKELKNIAKKGKKRKIKNKN